MTPRRRLLAGGAVTSVLVLLLGGLGLYIKAGPPQLLEVLVITSGVILSAVLVGAAIASTDHTHAPPPDEAPDDR